jgi:hypothetical protein
MASLARASRATATGRIPRWGLVIWGRCKTVNLPRVFLWGGWLEWGVWRHASSLELGDGYQRPRWSFGHGNTSFDGGMSWGSSSGGRLGAVGFGWARRWQQQSKGGGLAFGGQNDHGGVFILGKTPYVRRVDSLTDSISTWSLIRRFY